MSRPTKVQHAHFIFNSIQDLHHQLRQFNGTLAQRKYLGLTAGGTFHLSNEPSNLTVATLPAGFVLQSLHQTPIGILHKLVLTICQGWTVYGDGGDALQSYVSSKDIWRTSPASKASKSVIRNTKQ